MLGNRRNLILAIVGVIIFVLLFLVYVWRGTSRVREAPQVFPKAGGPAPVPFGFGTAKSPAAEQGSSGGILDTLRKALGGQGEEVFAPQPPAEKKFLSLLPPQERAIEELRRKLQTGEIKIQTPAPRKYTTEEIFHLQYPDYFLDYLSGLQDFMAEEGYLKSSERASFKSHEDVLKFVRTYINFLADSGALIFRNRADRDQYIESVLTNLLALNVIEADLLEKGALTPSP